MKRICIAVATTLVVGFFTVGFMGAVPAVATMGAFILWEIRYGEREPFHYTPAPENDPDDPDA